MQFATNRTSLWSALVMSGIASIAPGTALCSTADDRQIIAALDTKYQLAVKHNDAETMARILHDRFVLVTGDGSIYTRANLLEEARSKKVTYERQEEEKGTQTVRIWGDTAVVTAKLWLKGVNDGVPFDRKLWFSDTYVRTRGGWRYVFGQASLSLPKETPALPPESAGG